MALFRTTASVGIPLALSAVLTSAAASYAQGPVAPPRPAPGAPPAASAAPQAPPMPPDYVPASTTPVNVPMELTKPTAGGITGEQVAKRAALTSYSAKAADENLRGAAARVDAAWAAFLPRLSGTASYTRLSNFAPPTFGSGSLVATPVQSGTLLNANSPLIAEAFVIPLVLNQWLFQARIVVPISDYFLKINQNYESVTRSADAYRFDAISARAVSWSNGKIAYYTWLRARGGIVVAAEALNDQRTHLKDAQNQFAAGNASRADVLRSETAVASAELALERAKNLADLTEKQVRVAMHAPDDEALVPGEALDSPLPPYEGNVKQMTIEAESSRYEIKSADANADAARKAVAVQKAGKYPVLQAFGDGIEGNPNSRRFPATQDWFGTWDVGAQLTWSPNDLIVANSSIVDAESRAAAIEAQRGVTRDGIDTEVLQNYQAVREEDFAIESSKREVASATEAYRVASELFNNGRGTSTTLTDAESDLTRSRLDLLNAYADARIARIRLDHSLGRDTRQFAGGQ